MHAQCLSSTRPGEPAARQAIGSPQREPCFADGRWKLREAEPLFTVTKLLSQVCLNLPNSTDLGGKEGRKGKMEGERKKGRRESSGKVQGELARAGVAPRRPREKPHWDISTPKAPQPEG